MPKYYFVEVDDTYELGIFMMGLLRTLQISFFSLIISLFIGFFAALASRAPFVVVNGLSRFYVEIIRNTPLLVQIYIFYYIISPVFGIERYWTGILALAFFEGAYSAEIIRGGIESIKKGQWEVAHSLGLKKITTYRYVIIPQMLPLILPALTNQMVSLIKNSSIVSVIAIYELTTYGRDIIAETFLSFEVWLNIAFLYLILTITFSAFTKFLEKKFSFINLT